MVPSLTGGPSVGRGRRPPVTLYSDASIGSYAIVGDLMAATLAAAGWQVETRDFDTLPASLLRQGPVVIVQNTIGPRFVAVPSGRNVALVHHEWDRYPAAWVDRLNAFTEVWTTTTFVRQTLVRSGVTVPVRLVRPALDIDLPPRKADYTPGRPVRFFACGAAHFRKGFHLLLSAFLQAFPNPGEAELVIHTEGREDWVSPRRDIVFDMVRAERTALLARYRDSDFHVTASLGEGLGLPLAEAVLAGVPVVAAAWGGHRDLLRDGDFLAVRHAVVPQPFCSRPDYYAPGQRCVLVSVPDLARVLRRACRTTAEARRQMAERARGALLTRYGRGAAVRRITAANEGVLAR